MRILCVCGVDLGVGSGTRVRARLLVDGFLRAGCQVGVVSPGIAEQLIISGAVFFQSSKGEPLTTTIQKAARNLKADIIFGITEGWLDVLFDCGRDLSIPVYADIHGLGFIEAIESSDPWNSKKKRIKFSLRWQKYMRKIAGITVANPELYRYLRIFHRNALPVIGMTDIGHFSPDSGNAISEHPNRPTKILYSGNLFKYQGVDIAINAMRYLQKKNHKSELIIAGSIGRDDNFLEDCADLTRSGALTYLGQVDYASMPSIIRSADICVVPRPWSVTAYLAFPQKIPDFMATGACVIASDIAPHRAALTNPECGILCKPNGAGLAEAIKIGTDGDRRRVLGAAARNKAMTNYDHLGQTQRILRFMKD